MTEPKPLRRNKFRQFLDPRDARTMERMMGRVADVDSDLSETVRKDTLTTRGDLFVRDAADVDRLPLGAIGRVLQSDGTDALWQQLTSVSISDFAEAAQDAVGAALADTPTVDLSYNDAGNAISAAVIANSIDNTLLADMPADTIKGRANGAGPGDPTNLTATQVAAIISAAISSALNITSGTYTPTLTNEANLDGSTASVLQFLRVGSVVLVSGRIDVNATAAATLTQVGISLPIASTLAATTQVGGVAFASSVAGMGAGIFADAANARARMQWISSDTNNQIMHLVFAYLVV